MALDNVGGVKISVQYTFTEFQFKVDRLQIILVAKNIYIYVSQLFISRMPKMRAIPQLVSAPLMCTQTLIGPNLAVVQSQ